MKKQYCILFFAFSLFFSCDPNIYTGHDYQAQELSETTIVEGYVSQFYRNDSVYHAQVRVGSQETLTNENGFFYLNYVLSEDELRNKPTVIQILKENYYTSIHEVILSPTTNSFDFSLRYAAPIIIDTRRRKLDSLNICQAIIKDYQGIESLKSCQLTYYYLDDFLGNIVDSLKLDIPLVSMPDENTGYYQLIMNDPLTKLNSDSQKVVLKNNNQEEIFIVHPTRYLGPFYYIQVIDNEGYQNKVLHSIKPNFPDALLFDIVTYELD